MKDFTPRNHIAGRDYTTAIRGTLLSDRRIEHYILAGHYGETVKLNYIAAHPKPVARVPKPKNLALTFLSRHAK